MMIFHLLTLCIVQLYPNIPTAIKAYMNPMTLLEVSFSEAELKRARAKELRRSETRNQERRVRSDASQT